MLLLLVVAALADNFDFLVALGLTPSSMREEESRSDAFLLEEAVDALWLDMLASWKGLKGVFSLSLLLDTTWDEVLRER